MKLAMLAGERTDTSHRLTLSTPVMARSAALALPPPSLTIVTSLANSSISPSTSPPAAALTNHSAIRLRASHRRTTAPRRDTRAPELRYTW
ncbi:hypothetical protein [Nonomuraea sp. B19D2]|uniref:hypothetical protein n=1 Tax=Nonomuraea sp. B19D2 TaxID=3159561 RepID=UPI0032DB005F